MTTAEYPLPAQEQSGAARKSEGFATPKQDNKPQCARILPKRVLPVVFLPGIMGSNLRMSVSRQKDLNQKDNIAWRPDSLGITNVKKNAQDSPRERQLRLDPLQTTVDIYDPSGVPDVSGDGRHENVKLKENFQTASLADDPPTSKNRRTAEQKARERGWGEVFFGSYGHILQELEFCLNNTFNDGRLAFEWQHIVGVNPCIWSADDNLNLQPITETQLRKVAAGCWFPVYAFGYNWLQCNGVSAKNIAVRIEKIISEFKNTGYDCNQVIVVTHSMGGLVGRALLHPEYGNIQEKILGIVHGVMPAIGAPAAYKRMRAGFEDSGMEKGPAESLSAKVAGNYGSEVTAVLANSPGALQLLPTKSYGNGWLRIKHREKTLEMWPKNGDPFSEIYKVRGKWYSLFREEWINPSKLKEDRGGGTFERTCNYLDVAQEFHKKIVQTFHSNSYAHYGADQSRRSFGEVIWEIDHHCENPKGWQNWPIISDNGQGKIELVSGVIRGNEEILEFSMGSSASRSVFAQILKPTAPGDQTVPVKSADHQLNSGIFRGVFRQHGYEHQSSCKNWKAINSIMYSIIRIAEEANWKC